MRTEFPGKEWDREEGRMDASFAKVITSNKFPSYNLTISPYCLHGKELTYLCNEVALIVLEANRRDFFPDVRYVKDATFPFFYAWDVDEAIDILRTNKFLLKPYFEIGLLRINPDKIPGLESLQKILTDQSS